MAASFLSFFFLLKCVWAYNFVFLYSWTIRTLCFYTLFLDSSNSGHNMLPVLRVSACCVYLEDGKSPFSLKQINIEMTFLAHSDSDLCLFRGSFLCRSSKTALLLSRKRQSQDHRNTKGKLKVTKGILGNQVPLFLAFII